MAQEVLGNVFKKGEEIFQNVSGKLLERPAVQKAVEVAMVGKSKVDEQFAIALKRMNVQTRGEFRALKSRVESLEMQVSELKEALAEAVARSKAPREAAPRARRASKKA